jgi:hypothetical protein
MKYDEHLEANVREEVRQARRDFYSAMGNGVLIVGVLAGVAYFLLRAFL